MKSAVISLLVLACIQACGVMAEEVSTTTQAQAQTSATSALTTGTVSTPPEVVGTTVTLPSGLKYIDLVIGTGPRPKENQNVVIHYVGRLENGKIFDSSRDRLIPVPLKFQLGTSAVVPGMEEGVKTMRLGGRRLLVIPPDLGYGKRGSGAVPPDATLLFDVELVGIN
jgi:peptidylprolyl isomerase